MQKFIFITFLYIINKVIVMYHQIVSITKKGQATLPSRLRKRYHLKDKAMVIDVDDGILIKSLVKPSEEKGSLKEIFENKTARNLIAKSRAKEFLKEKNSLR